MVFASNSSGETLPVSLSGLDLSFLRKTDGNGCQPGRYRIDEATGELVSAAEWRRRNPNIHARGRSDTVASPYFMPDVDSAYGSAWKSIIDGSQISSRSNWREHNKRNGVEQVDRDYWGKTEDDHVTEIRERMGYDPSLIGESEVFSWREPESLTERTDGRKNREPDPE